MPSTRTLIEQSIDPITTVEELIRHLQELVPDPGTAHIGIGGDATTCIGIRVFERTLSDGSTVIDISIDDLEA